MSHTETLYSGISRAAWGLFFLFFHINLGTLTLLSPFVGWLLLLSALKLLGEERRDLVLLRPLGIGLTLYHFADWLLVLFGRTLDIPLLGTLATIAQLYFLFQLLTDCAALATQYQHEEDDLDTRICRWRNLQTILLTLGLGLLYLPMERFDWWGIFMTCLAVAALFAAVMSMATLFSLRRLFQESELAE